MYVAAGPVDNYEMQNYYPSPMRKPGRPPKHSTPKRAQISVRLTPADYRYLLRIGKGSATTGVEVLLQRAKINLTLDLPIV